MATGDQIQIPCVMMRGGTSRGPFFLASDLPADPNQRDALLLSVMGAGHELEIDGIGGGNPLTSKVAIVGPSTVPGADVDYLFAQVRVRDRIVDTSPNCGNMLAAVGPFAIEFRLGGTCGGADPDPHPQCEYRQVDRGPGHDAGRPSGLRGWGVDRRGAGDRGADPACLPGCRRIQDRPVAADRCARSI